MSTNPAGNKHSFSINSGYMVISDPSYDLRKTGNQCFRILSVEPGEWEIISIRRHCQVSGLRGEGGICRIRIGHKNVNPWITPYYGERKKEDPRGKKIGMVSSDTGQTVFCDFEHYRKDEGIEDSELWEELDLSEEKGHRFFSKICKITTDDAQFGVFKNGCATRSGWGDGYYKIYGKTSEDGSLVDITVDYE